jgi:hypothetical protein
MNRVKAEAVFITHVIGSRKPTALKLTKGPIYVVTWPGTCTDPEAQIPFWDSSRMTLLEIGNREWVANARNNIVEYAASHGISRLWQVDDDVRYAAKVENDVRKNLGKVGIDWREIEFEEDAGLCGILTMGVMFDSWKKKTFSNGLIFGAFCVNVPNMKGLKWRPGGREDLEMQLQCLQAGIKTQCRVDWGFAKQPFVSKTSIANPIERQWNMVHHLYSLHGDNLKFIRTVVRNVEVIDVAIKKYDRYLDPVKTYDDSSVESLKKCVLEEYYRNPESIPRKGLKCDESKVVRLEGIKPLTAWGGVRAL